MQQPRLALCIEQALGHRAHGLNIERVLAARDVSADVLRIEYPGGSRLPAPWAVRASVDAYRQLRRLPAPDVAFFHTQTVALLAPPAARGRPYVVSVDATPAQLDTLGRWYEHKVQPWGVEALKRRWYARVFRGAAALVTWSAWAAKSLAEDYGVSGARMLVAHPGASQAFFDIDRASSDDTNARPQILFVGGDFERKGGNALLEAFAPLADRAELVLVTPANVPAQPGVRVLPDVQPGSEAQRRAFAEADIFCLPTQGDCTPVAIGEALSAGLPVVTTEIASNPEWVPPEAGVLVPPQDPAALGAALRALVEDVPRRRRMSQAARTWAGTHMAADRNADRILDLLADVAGEGREARLARAARSAR